MKDPEKTEWLKLNKGEDILYWEHPTILVAIPSIVTGIIIALVGVIATLLFREVVSWYLLLLVPGGGIITFHEYLNWVTRHYVLTTKRVVKKTGIMSRDVDELTYEDIMNMNDNQSIVERLFRFGDIIIYTAGTASAEMELENIPKLSKASDILSEKSSAAD